MGDEAENKVLKLEHFVYGSHEGYRMKAYSKGIDLDIHTDPFQGMFLPIKQSDIKEVGDIRMIIPVDDSTTLLSKILKGGKDDHARETMANHTVVISRNMLRAGEITYEDVDLAMTHYEKNNIEAIGDIPPLEVIHQDKKMEISELKNYMREDVIRNLISQYIEYSERKVFLHYRASNAEKRIRAAYLLSLLIDLELNIVPLSIFTDIPYGGAKRVFNLVISRAMIGVKPGGDWVMLPVEKKRTWTSIDKKEFAKELDRVLGRIYH